MESFALDGNAAVTVHEGYQKDKQGGWIWGNSALMNEDQKQALQAVLKKHRTTFANSIEDLPGYNGAVGLSMLGLDSNKAIVQPPQWYSPAEQSIIKAKT